MEHERLRERMIVKQNEAEDAIYGDKDKFVTGAYKRKLEERKKWEEEQKRNDEEENKGGGVEKRGMGGFYRNMEAIKGGRGEGEGEKKKEEEGEGGEKKKAKKPSNDFIIEHTPVEKVIVEDPK
ncbi:hypothetical protein TrRE_jg5803, partial [Triparma retinervis]